jgi:hypothetical protein
MSRKKNKRLNRIGQTIRFFRERKRQDCLEYCFSVKNIEDLIFPAQIKIVYAIILIVKEFVKRS